MASEKIKEEDQWLGKRCLQCESPVNYAYRGIIDNLCGKCTDEVRQKFKIDLREEIMLETLPGLKIELAGEMRPNLLIAGAAIFGIAIGAITMIIMAASGGSMWTSILESARNFLGEG